MTSLAFSFGVLPLAIATGASAASQNAIGTGVLGGMISATVLAIFFVPVFFVVVMKLFDRPAKAPQGAAGPTEAAAGESVCEASGLRRRSARSLPSGAPLISRATSRAGRAVARREGRVRVR